MIICKICGKECKNNGSFANHLKVHYNEISAKEYYDKFIKNEGEDCCIICDNTTDFLGVTRGYKSTCGKEICVKKSYSSMDKELYAKRNGLSKYKAKKEINRKLRGRYSPFNYKHWMERGYEEKEAKYKANSMSPVKKEYWMERGYEEKESVIIAKKYKDTNNKKGAINSKKRSYEDMRHSSPRCVEYWIDKGYTLEESKEKVSEHQTTFSLNICIKKYGTVDGLKRWKKRQKLWNKNYKKSNFSIVSQDLFWEIYKNLNEKKNIKFATLLNGQRDDSGNNNEFLLELSDSVIKPDFIDIKNKKIIEFDGDYWHSKKRKRKEDEERDKKLIEEKYEILRIKEKDYRENPKEIIDKCLKFLRK